MKIQKFKQCLQKNKLNKKRCLHKALFGFKYYVFHMKGTSIKPINNTERRVIVKQNKCVLDEDYFG